MSAILPAQTANTLPDELWCYLQSVAAPLIVLDAARNVLGRNASFAKFTSDAEFLSVLPENYIDSPNSIMYHRHWSIAKLRDSVYALTASTFMMEPVDLAAASSRLPCAEDPGVATVSDRGQQNTIAVLANDCAVGLGYLDVGGNVQWGQSIRRAEI